MTATRLVHLSDLHFGAYVDLEQIAALERLLPEQAAAAIVISGDLSQRARHGEFQRALAFVELCRRIAPTLPIPGNHDVRWWASPFGLRGQGPKYRHYRRYFGDVLGPVLEVPGAVIVGTVSAHGLASGSVTWNPRDLTVKGHLARQEVMRAGAVFGGANPEACRVLALHHNVLRGQISNRWGLARPQEAQRRLVECGAELILCGHDHQEAVGRLDGGTVVATAGTHTFMTRGKRPSVFNLIDLDSGAITVYPMKWTGSSFEPGELTRYERR
ncbi:MAG TPA: metallophosphoesterase [Gemmatimonadales bacterium]